MTLARMHTQRKVNRKRYRPRFTRQRQIKRGGGLGGSGGGSVGIPTVASVSPTPTIKSASSRLFTATGTNIANVTLTVHYVATGASTAATVAGAYVSATSFTFTLPAGAIAVAGTVPWNVDVGPFAGIIGASIVVTDALGRQVDPANPGDYTIAEIQAWVDDNADMADEVLAAEQAGQARSTLISWLQGFISDRDEGHIP